MLQKGDLNLYALLKMGGKTRSVLCSIKAVFCCSVICGAVKPSVWGGGGWVGRQWEGYTGRWECKNGFS